MTAGLGLLVISLGLGVGLGLGFSLGPVQTVHGPSTPWQTVYTAVHGPCIHGPSMTRTRPCTWACLRPCTRSFVAWPSSGVFICATLC